MSLVNRIAFTAALAAAASGCADLPTDSGTPSEAPPPLAHAASAGHGPVSRFELQATANGSFVPGTPVNIHIRLEAKLASRNAEVVLTLPELEFLRAAGKDRRYEVPIGTPIPIHSRWTGAMSSGRVRTHSSPVVFPEPGYYRAIVSGFDSGAETEAGGREVHNQTVQEIWLLIDHKGGRVTADYDPSVIPTEYLSQPGPFRPRRQKSAGVSKASATDLGALSSASTMQGDTEYYQFFYYRTGDGVSTAVTVPDAGVIQQNYAWDYGEPRGYGSASTRTDLQGRFSVACPTYSSAQWGDDWYDLQIQLINAKIHMNRGHFTYPGEDTSTCGYSSPTSPYQIYAPHSVEARVFREISITAKAAESFFGRSRGQVNVDADALGNRYDKYIDEVNLEAAHVWGKSGVRLIAHEYGHAYHEKALGGIPRYINISCWDHYPYETAFEDPSCAFSEGFAHYLAAVTRKDAGQRFEMVEQDAGPASGVDGSRMERYVAAFLYDLTDSDTHEPFDNVSFPGSYLADVIATCNVNVDGVFERNRAIIDVIFCLERQVDPAVTGSSTYFTGLQHPFDFRVSATLPSSWNRQAIRTLWLKVLYNQ